MLSVHPDMGNKSEKDNHSQSLSIANLVSISDGASNSLSSSGKIEFWLVRMEKPGVEVVTKAQMVDHYTRILMKVFGKYVISSSTYYQLPSSAPPPAPLVPSLLSKINMVSECILASFSCPLIILVRNPKSGECISFFLICFILILKIGTVVDSQISQDTE